MPIALVRTYPAKGMKAWRVAKLQNCKETAHIYWSLFLIRRMRLKQLRRAVRLRVPFLLSKILDGLMFGLFFLRGGIGINVVICS